MAVKGKTDGNGKKDKTNIKALFEEMRQERELILKGQKALQDEVLNLKEKVDGDNKGYGKAALRMVETLYDTPDRLVIELSDFSHLMCRPIASALTLERIGKKEVRSGKESLLSTYLLKLLRARRSIGGKHLSRGRMLATDQLGLEKSEAQAEFDMGREEK